MLMRSEEHSLLRVLTVRRSTGRAERQWLRVPNTGSNKQTVLRVGGVGRSREELKIIQVIRSCCLFETLTEPQNHKEWKKCDDSDRKRSFFPAFATLCRPFISAVCCCYSVCLAMCTVLCLSHECIHVIRNHAPPVHYHPGEPEERGALFFWLSQRKLGASGRSCSVVFVLRSHRLLVQHRFLTPIVFQRQEAFTIFVILKFCFTPICVSSSVICWWNVLTQ